MEFFRRLKKLLWRFSRWGRSSANNAPFAAAPLVPGLKLRSLAEPPAFSTLPPLFIALPQAEPLSVQLITEKASTELVVDQRMVTLVAPILRSLPWSPTPYKRVSTRDFRVGYSHVWALEAQLAKVSRPYLLRVDLARLAPPRPPVAATPHAPHRFP